MTPLSDQSKRKIDRHFAGGVAWTAAAKWITQAFAWISLIVAARLLSKSDFGIAEMAGFFVGLTNILAEFGVGTAAMQMRELEPRVLAQLHTFSCLACTLAFIVSAAAAPPIAWFFGDPRLKLLVLATNTSFFVTGFQAVPLGLLQKDMDYRRLSIADAWQSLTQAAFLVGAAWAGAGYWSLLIGPAAGKLCACLLACKWKPIPFAIPRWKDLRAPLRMGGQMAIGRLAWSAYTQSDGVVAAKMLGQSMLGVYRMAMNLATEPAEKISGLIMRATGPLFARVQDDVALARRYFLTLAELLIMIELPLMLGFAAVCPEVIHLALQDKWAAVAEPLRWLALFTPIQTLGTLAGQLLVSRRRTRFTMGTSIVSFFVMPAAFIAAAHWYGTVGLAAAWIALSPVTVFPSIWIGLRSVGLKFRDLAGALAPSAICASVMTVGVISLRRWPAIGSQPVGVRLAVEVAAGALIYAGCLFAFFGPRVKRYIDFARDLRRHRSDAGVTAA